MANEYEVVIRQEAGGIRTEIFILAPHGAGGKHAIVHFDGQGEGTAETFDPHQAAVKPTMVLHWEQAEPILAAFSKALNRLGVRPKDISAAEGELKAQTAHLDDLRKLLKLTK